MMAYYNIHYNYSANTFNEEFEKISKMPIHIQFQRLIKGLT